MNTEVVNPNVSNFITALRDIGYNLEIAIADILDNSISANAKKIDINCVGNDKLSILDNGTGMTELELVEAMRLGSKNPTETRSTNDLGRFGLGLKTASFSQCKILTVITKNNDIICNRQWDLNFIEAQNQWILKTLDNYDNYQEELEQLKQLKSGTVVIWEEIDRFKNDEITPNLYKLRNHLSLVFHRFLEKGSLKINLNENKIEEFNPFNPKHLSTQEEAEEELMVGKNKIKIKPYILPHHSKISQKDYETYGTEDGYLKAQGFYLYRANRLLIHGTWFGLHKMTDAHKLIRIQIDIPNKCDIDWGIDVKKSIAKPASEIKAALKRTISQITVLGSRPYTGRGKKIEDKKKEKFWKLEMSSDKKLSFKLNKENAMYETLFNSLNNQQKELFDMFLRNIERNLPLDSILSQLQQNPHNVEQKQKTSKEEIEESIKKLKELGFSDDYIKTIEW
ncbi:ATP-binding protein [Cetobacterium sp.]|uniref:ATP-binding protein n=1 Tax=Cetobacterium sp. TaxID=2071632 RepID=UPI003F2E78F5